MASTSRHLFRFVSVTSLARPRVVYGRQKLHQTPLNSSAIRSISTTISSKTKLAEVGKLEPIKVEGNYDTGQLFLHKIFGYRGVVLRTWNPRIHDKNEPINPGEKFKESGFPKSMNPHKHDDSSKEVKGKTHPYYTVLIDDRDFQHITNRSQTESVTFLGPASDNSRNLLAIPGLDYVAHEDILPYISEESTPIQHDLFKKFLAPSADGSKLVAQQTWENLLKINRLYLEIFDVHKETTENIRVTVMPFYMGVREQNNNSKVYWWRYCIRLENLGEMAVTLRERNWRIFSLSGTLETVRGRGVMAQEPKLSKEQPAFQYSSHVSLQAASGHMWGMFRMEREDGKEFDCRIPPFSLESRTDDDLEPDSNPTQ